MKTINNPPPGTWDSIISRPLLHPSQLESNVQEIINDIKLGGDQQLMDYTEKFDGVRLSELSVPVPTSVTGLPSELKQAIQTAYENIEKFHRSQEEEPRWIETMPGVRCCRRSTPIESVGLYIPGGSAPLFSTLLMLGVPARIAGCKNIIVCTPPQQDGTIHPAILYTAGLLNLTELHPIGGAQAIAAMAYGTESVPKVYKIFGPGNQYVTAAKKLISTEVAIDFPAGPSEVAILADAMANPEFIAADLLSQAEHGPDSQVVLVTNSGTLVEQVERALTKQLERLPRKNIAKKSLKQSKMLVFTELDTAMEFLNTYAPEHLLLNMEEPHEWAEKVVNAGSVFLGAFTPESAGDYASGTNHTLPTNGNARMYAGVSLDTFLKKITFQEISRTGIEEIGDTIEIMAVAEGLNAHQQAVAIRRESLKNQP